MKLHCTLEATIILYIRSFFSISNIIVGDSENWIIHLNLGFGLRRTRWVQNELVDLLSKVNFSQQVGSR